MNREVLWRLNYKFPLVGFRLIAPLACLPRALPFSLSPATSKRLLQAPATQAIVLERKKEKTKQQQKNLAIICLVCDFHLAYCCVSQCFLERENNFDFILLVLFLSEFFFMFFVTKFSSICVSLSSSISPDRQPVSVSHVFQDSNNSLFVISWLCLYQDLLTLQTNVSVDGNVE